MYTNADQFRNKTDEMQNRIGIYMPDVIAINEVKPKSRKFCCNPAEFDVDPNRLYDAWDNNLDNDIGRGQLLIIKKVLKSTQVYMDTKFDEGVFAEIPLQGQDRLLIALIYRSDSGGKDMADKLNQLIQELATKGYSHLLVLGDFNYKYIDWPSMSSTVPMEKKFLDCIQDTYLTQHIDEPTRWRGTDNPSLIDLVFTNEENMVNDIDYQAPLGKSDHAVICFNLLCYTGEGRETIERKKYHLDNYDAV